jgi:hypothetical protein
LLDQVNIESLQQHLFEALPQVKVMDENGMFFLLTEDMDNTETEGGRRES